MAGRSVTGFQLAGLTNFSMQRVDGVQVSGFFNYTKGRLNGTQLALVNFSGNVEGKFSKMSTKYSGLQIGAFNKTTRNMDGFQIGLVNWVGDMNGLQVGLINISNKNQKYPIGLINVNNDEYGYVRAYASELFLYNFELATGSKHIINTISYHLNPSKLVAKGEPKSAVGYAIGKTILRKFIFYNGDLQFQHVNYDKGFTKDLSLLTKLRGTVGIDPFYGTKLRDIFIFGGVTLNSYVSKQQTQLSNEKLRLSYKENGNKSWETWIGFMVGINVDIH
jgi:hypothetical protein